MKYLKKNIMQDNKKLLQPTNGKVIKHIKGNIWAICHYINGILFGYFEYHMVNGEVEKEYYAR